VKSLLSIHASSCICGTDELMTIDNLQQLAVNTH